jgi:steroid delta-isomerase-like uncharacterized protein
MMRTIGSFAALLAAACSSEGAIVPQPAPIDTHAFDMPRSFDAGTGGPTEKERAAATSYATALASPGFGALSPLLAADVHYFFPGIDDGRGRDGALGWHEQLFGAFDARAFALSRVSRTANTQTLEWVMSGKQAKDFMGVPATGKPVAIAGATVLWTKDDGSITDIHTFFDVAVVKAQLGAGPTELASLPQPSPPSAPPLIVDQSSSPLEEANLKAVHTTIDDDLEKPAPEAYLDALSDDVEIRDAEHAQPSRGKADAKAWFAALHKSVGSLHSVVDNSWAMGGSVVVEYTLNGTQIAPLWFIPARPDRPVALRLLEVIELRDGKMARISRYGNPAQILQSGSVPPPLEVADAGAKRHK